MADRRERGGQGEQAVADDLLRRGYRLLARNYRCRWGEIDLIAADAGGTLCFVEVKTRSPGAIALPRESVTPAKQRRLRAAAGYYLAQRQLDCPCRFDVAEVYSGPDGSGTRQRIHYITGAF